MEVTLLAFLFISIPGLLSATCSSPSQNAPSPGGEYAKSIMNSHLMGRESGNVQGNPREGARHHGMAWAEDYAPSRRSSPPLEQQLQNKQQEREQVGRCENGWCGEDGSCSCNPCWSGPTCQEYVDRFSPRFLAEEPFFIVDSTSAITISPFPSVSSVDSGEGNEQPPPPLSFPSTPSSDPVPVPRLQKEAMKKPVKSFSQSFTSSASPLSSSTSNFAAFADSSAKSNSLDSNLSNTESKLSVSTTVQPPAPGMLGGGNTRSPPLFRIEAADDDLGLTCQLGQVGPAATCPCATPRYKVIGASTTIPDDRSFTSNNYPKETDINRPSRESSFYNSVTTETKLSISPSSFSPSSNNASEIGVVVAAEDAAADYTQLEDCPRLRATKCRKLNSIMFYADEETGDVFLQNGFNLQPEKYYFVTLQVSALPVNISGYKPWKEQIIATLYVKLSTGSQSNVEAAAPVKKYAADPLNAKQLENREAANEPTNGKLDTLDSEEFYDDDDDAESVDTDTNRKAPAMDDEQGEDLSERSTGGIREMEASHEKSIQALNYHSRKDFEGKNDRVILDTTHNNIQHAHQMNADEQGKKKIMSFEKNSGWKQNQNLRRTIPHKMLNAKNKLPYALRADRPHFKYSPKSPNPDLFGSGSSSSSSSDITFESPTSKEGFTSYRKKREVPEKSQFKMSISRVNGVVSNTTSFIPMGVVTKLRLQIQVAPTPVPTDFALEIHTSRAKTSNIKFTILSAHVTSIGSDISFDKGTTNLAPVMIPWKNSTVYESAMWKWKNVSCKREREDNQPILAPTTTTQGNNGGGRRQRIDEIFIEFDVVPVYPKDSPNVVSRRMGTSSSTSAAPWQRHEKSSKSNLGTGGGGHKDLSDDKDDWKPHHLSTSIISQSPRKVTKQFNVILVPVSAYITLSNGHREPADYHQSFLERYDENLEDERVKKIRKEIDGEGDGATARNHDAIFIKDDARSHDDSLHSSLPNDISTWEWNSGVVSHIMLPVKYSQVPNKGDLSGTTNQTDDTSGGGTNMNLPETSFKEKERKEANDDEIGVGVELEGPTEILQGGWVSYTIKVYLNHSSQFQLRLEPLQGNEIQYQDTVSVGDIRVLDVGKSFALSEKMSGRNKGFRVTCRKLHGRKGDYCIVESPVLQHCRNLADERGQLKGDEAADMSNSWRTSSITKSGNNCGETQPGKNGEEIDNKENMIRFEGVIYGFPGSAPGSQFALRAYVYVHPANGKKPDSYPLHERPSLVDGEFRSTHGVEEEKTLSGTIVHRKQNIRVGSPPGFDSPSMDSIDGKIPVMKEFPAYHYRKRRNVLFHPLPAASRNLTPMNVSSVTPSSGISNFRRNSSKKQSKLDDTEATLENKVGKRGSSSIQSQNTPHHASKSLTATQIDNLSGKNMYNVNTWEKVVKRASTPVAVRNIRERKSKRSSAPIRSL